MSTKVHTHFVVRPAGTVPLGPDQKCVEFVKCVAELIQEHTIYEAVIATNDPTSFAVWVDQEYAESLHSLNTQVCSLAHLAKLKMESF